MSSVKLSVEHLPKKAPETFKEKQPRKLPPEDGEVMDGSSLTVVNWVSGASHSGDNYRHNTRDSQKHVWECWKTEFVHTVSETGDSAKHVHKRHKKDGGHLGKQKEGRA